MGIGRFVYTPILPFMAEALSLTKSEAGLIASANFAGYLVGALLAATPWLKGSRRGWLVAGLAASGVTTLLTAAFEARAGLAAACASSAASRAPSSWSSPPRSSWSASPQPGAGRLAARPFRRRRHRHSTLRRHRVGARRGGLRLAGAMGRNRDRRASRLAGRRCPRPARSGRRERGPPARAGRVRRDGCWRSSHPTAFSVSAT